MLCHLRLQDSLSGLLPWSSPVSASAIRLAKIFIKESDRPKRPNS